MSISIAPIWVYIIFNKKGNEQLIDEVIILSTMILTLGFVDKYIYMLLFLIIVVIQSFLYNKYYYLFTSFLVVLYSIYKTSDYTFASIQIFAYIGYLLNKYIKKKNNSDGLEFIMDDINSNVVKFCNFITTFSNSSNNIEYEKNVSECVRILIENFRSKCKNRNICYAERKYKTYIFLKEILSKKEQANSENDLKEFFSCLYYFDITKKALLLQNQYDLLKQSKEIDFKLYGVCYSVQNYFISLFEKASPGILKILNFQKILNDNDLKYDKCEHSIISENRFQFKVYSSNKTVREKIENEALAYFSKNDVTIENNDCFVHIYPRKKFKVLCDSATLSHNNCNVSGDNFLFKTINASNFICALSDGMGSGLYANQLSQQTLKMVDQITECSIDFETSLEILNNFFKTKDSLDSYATLDFVDVNLSNGVLNLYKMGSSTTYILRDDIIIPIYNNNLPFGINDLITKEQYILKENDLIILVSDGVNDYIDEAKLISFIEKLKDESPHRIVYEILQKIYYENGKQIKDDMSCIVLKMKNC